MTNNEQAISSDDQGDLVVHRILTLDDADALRQLDEVTHHFLAMLDHVSRFHRPVVTGDFLGSVLDELDHLEIKYGWPTPSMPGHEL